VKQQQYANAVEAYTKALALQPTAIYYGNRAAALHALRRFEDAVADCNMALLLDPAYTKAYTRMGCAHHVTLTL
jgi:small glutamine-rich tetratricopeptide repeat-containing protein alpha